MATQNVLRWSPSRLLTFEACMWQGYIKYVLGKETKPNFGSETGRAGHKGIALIINNNLELKEAIKQALSESKLPLSLETITKHVTAASVYYQTLIQQGFVLKAEQEYNTVLSDDLNDIFAPGHKMILDLEDVEKSFVGDWKTGAVEEARDNFSLGMYCWFKARQTGRKNYLGRLIFTGHECQSTEHVFTEEDFQQIMARALAIADQVKTALLQLSMGGDPKVLFPATKHDKCKYCAFPEDCPLKQAIQEKKEIEKITDYDTAVKAAEELLKLNAEADRLNNLLKAFVKDTKEPILAGGLMWDFKTTQSWQTPKSEEERIKVFAELAKKLISKGITPWQYFKADLPLLVKNNIFTEDEIKGLGISKSSSKNFKSFDPEKEAKNEELAG